MGATEETGSLVEWIDPAYRTAGIFARSKTWTRLDAKTPKAYFLLVKIPTGLHPHIEIMAHHVEKAMTDKMC